MFRTLIAASLLARGQSSRHADPALPARIVPIFVLNFVASVLLAAPTAAQGADTVWYRITTSAGEPIGYASEAVAARAGNGRTVTSNQHVEIDVPSVGPMESPFFSVGGVVDIDTEVVRSEDADGRTVAITVTRHERSDPLWSESRIAGDRVTVRRHDAAGTKLSTVMLPPGTRFDDGDGLFGGWDPAAVPELAFDDYDAAAGAVDHVTIAALPGSVPGTVEALRRREHDGAIVALARLTIGADGRIVEARSPMLGRDIDATLTTREAALQPHEALRIVSSSAVKSPYRIGDGALHGHIRYRFAFRDGMVFALPQTGEQRVAAGGGTATVDICADCGPGLSGAPDYLAAARRPGAWLESDAEPIRRLAARVRDEEDDAHKMATLTKITALRLPGVDFVGHYSALAALERRSGDCTESAALLAALGRAAGIPTKVASGLVYSRESYHGVSNVFMPHSWVLAYVDGHWRSYDAALGDFDVTHIALSINDGDDRSAYAAQQLAGLLQFEAMQEVRAPPAP